MRAALGAWLIAATLGLAALGLAACGPREQPPTPEELAAAEAAAEAEALFATTCGNLGMEAPVCACARARVFEAAGAQGLGYIGGAFGSDPTQAGPYEAAMSQEARNGAAQAFLDSQLACQDAANDPAFAAAAPAATLAPDSPIEQAVAACVQAGVAAEPVCRCRVQSVFDALGEDGARLAQADALGDTTSMARLADRRGGDWLDRAQDRLRSARLACS
jgi:hypothetical protein